MKKIYFSLLYSLLKRFFTVSFWCYDVFYVFYVSFWNFEIFQSVGKNLCQKIVLSALLPIISDDCLMVTLSSFSAGGF